MQFRKNSASSGMPNPIHPLRIFCHGEFVEDTCPDLSALSCNGWLVVVPPPKSLWRCRWCIMVATHGWLAVDRPASSCAPVYTDPKFLTNLRSNCQFSATALQLYINPIPSWAQSNTATIIDIAFRLYITQFDPGFSPNCAGISKLMYMNYNSMSWTSHYQVTYKRLRWGIRKQGRISTGRNQSS